MAKLHWSRLGVLWCRANLPSSIHVMVGHRELIRFNDDFFYIRCRHRVNSLRDFVELV